MKLATNITIALIIAFLYACDFEDKNINPNYSSTIEPGPLLTQSLLYTSNQGLSKRIQVGYCMMMVQQTASLERDEMAGDKYLETEMLGVPFNDIYSGPIKNIQEMINLTQNEESLSNTYAVGLIWKSFLFHRLTDLYGDIPYSEAGNGYYTQNYYPKYDAQEDVYKGIITEIEKALSIFDINKDPIVKGDIIYNGNIEKWKRFANSLLLRIGMRMEKADAELAKSVVTKAVSNGVMQEVDDICMVKHVTGKSATENPLSSVFKGHGLVNSGAVKISKTFMNHLKSNNDPRIEVYSSLPNGDNNVASQKGLPNGYDILSIYEGDPTYNSLSDYSTFNTATILLMDAPTIHMTHAEVELLKAEAILKNWISGDANESYINAITSSMKQQAFYGKGGIIEEDKIDAYLEQELFLKATTLESKLNVLGSEFWVTTFVNGYESYANWRRTGYPVLFPTSFANSPYKGNIPRRLSYPTEEYSINKTNVEEANQRQGEDKLSTRIWWDKK